jgi:hypothetical protein
MFSKYSKNKNGAQNFATQLETLKFFLQKKYDLKFHIKKLGLKISASQVEKSQLYFDVAGAQIFF